MQRLFRVAVLSVLAMVAVGCTNLSAVRETLQKQTVKLTGFEQMAFAPLDASESTAFELKNNDPVFQFDSGKSYFRAFQLPPYAENQNLRFEIEPWPGSPGNRGALRPMAVFLDKDKQVISQSTPAVMFKLLEFIRGSYYVGRIRVPRASQYAVIHAAPHPTPGSDAKLPYGFSDSEQSWPTGKLSVTVSTDQVATIGDIFERESNTRGRIFNVTAIDGERVHTSVGATRRANSGAGLNLMRTEILVREVPIKKTRVSIQGTHFMGAPIHETAAKIAGTFFEVTGDVDFQPEPWTHYEVHGTLSKEDSRVWIRRADNQEVRSIVLSTKVRDMQRKDEPRTESGGEN